MVEFSKEGDERAKKDVERYRSLSETVCSNVKVNRASESLSLDEDACAASAAPGEALTRSLRKRSTQYDNPELVRLLIGASPNGVGAATTRKSSREGREGRGGSFSDERLSYRTALEKLMPSSLVNEFEKEETQDGKHNLSQSTNENEWLETGCAEDDLLFIADNICKMFQHDDTGKISVSKFVSELGETGIRANDPRISHSMGLLKLLLRRMGTDFSGTRNCLLEKDEFKKCILNDAVFINRAIRNSFVIPEWHTFCSHLFGLYSLCKNNNTGQVSSFISHLADYDPNLWGVSVCTVDGQRFSAGDVNIPFLLQECSRVLNYAVALNDHGADEVHSYVGQEPSGRDMRELVLDEESKAFCAAFIFQAEFRLCSEKPHNPMINAGAIVIASLLKNSYKHMADKFEAIYNFYSKMAGKEHIGFSNTSYLSERQVSYRNFALGYFLRENKCFPENAKLEETLELLLQLYSIEGTCESLSVMAATLANGGICPTTGDFVIGGNCVRHVLSLMYCCGMNDYSGKFAFHVGLPARSNVSGAVMLVVPKVMGICLWCPSLDRHQNSARGVQFCMELVKNYNFHNYDNLRFTQRKLDPRRMEVEMKTQQVVLTLFSAANGDITALRRFLLQGVDLTIADYDGRTALHVAAAEGHMHCVKFLLIRAHVPSRAMDRWQNTPADDARARGFDEIADYLDRWYRAVEGRPRSSAPEVTVGRVKEGHNPRSLADTYTEECSHYVSDCDSGEGASVIESWNGNV